MNDKFKEILKGIKAAFDIPAPGTIAPAVPTAPAVAPAVPAVLAAPKDYTLIDGTVISITQAGDIPAVGDVVTVSGNVPAAGDLQLEDGTVISVDDAGVITAVAAAPPVTNDLSQAPPVPTLEERVLAIENAIARATQPAAMSAEDVDSLRKLKEDNAKMFKTINDIFSLIEQIGAEPTAEPKALTGLQKEKFEKKAKREANIDKWAAQMPKINVLK